jgi:hypothetical protein
MSWWAEGIARVVEYFACPACANKALALIPSIGGWGKDVLVTEWIYNKVRTRKFFWVWINNFMVKLFGMNVVFFTNVSASM